jgi:hypothetical protein
VERRNFISTLIGAMALGVPKSESLKRPAWTKSAEDRFNESLYQRLREKAKQGYEMDLMLIDPPMNFCNGRFRYVRFWVKNQEKPFAWYHPYPH